MFTIFPFCFLNMKHKRWTRRKEYLSLHSACSPSPRLSALSTHTPSSASCVPPPPSTFVPKPVPASTSAPAPASTSISTPLSISTSVPESTSASTPGLTYVSTRGATLASTSAPPPAHPPPTAPAIIPLRKHQVYYSPYMAAVVFPPKLDYARCRETRAFLNMGRSNGDDHAVGVRVHQGEEKSGAVRGMGEKGVAVVTRGNDEGEAKRRGHGRVHSVHFSPDETHVRPNGQARGYTQARRPAVEHRGLPSKPGARPHTRIRPARESFSAASIPKPPTQLHTTAHGHPRRSPRGMSRVVPHYTGTVNVAQRSGAAGHSTDSWI